MPVSNLAQAEFYSVLAQAEFYSILAQAEFYSVLSRRKRVEMRHRSKSGPSQEVGFKPAFCVRDRDAFCHNSLVTLGMSRAAVHLARLSELTWYIQLTTESSAMRKYSSAACTATGRNS